MSSETTRRQCTARSKHSGQRCEKAPIKGGTVCHKHGGAAPQVKRAAQMRLITLIEPAIATLAKEMVQAEKSVDRQRAANSILDRAGVPRSVSTPDSEASRALLIEKLREMKSKRTIVAGPDDYRESSTPPSESDATAETADTADTATPTPSDDPDPGARHDTEGGQE